MFTLLSAISAVATTIDPHPLDFGQVELGTSEIFPLYINYTDVPATVELTITSAIFDDAAELSLTPAASDDCLPFGASSYTIGLNVQFDPNHVSSSPESLGSAEFIVQVYDVVADSVVGYNHLYTGGVAFFGQGISPSPTATPLPAAFPLFATGLSALGLFGWRRKRQLR